MPFQPGADVFFRIMLDDFVFIFQDTGYTVRCEGGYLAFRWLPG